METTVVFPFVPVINIFFDLDFFVKISMSVRILIPFFLAATSISFHNLARTN
ncbi:MAG: hypothetical protein Ct9H300mP20_15000 [Gammaproteobacteria bacterium]|nr:MAG: hypothetical protein Ct9H300mP20_15000 [Gammaproteobacteria bacterium]